ncbi:MAG TPA: hypothetical protein VHZ81_07855 [Galbitalea sp.]|jgi:hypothetical protein|nr:hypothetical protein [Galbitalea sp.]
MKRGALATTLSAVVLFGVVLGLAGCTTPPPKPVPTATTARRQAVIYSVPVPQPGELARIVYQRPGAVYGKTISVPAGATGYNIDVGCTSSHPHQKVSFELTHGSTVVVDATNNCDGGDVRDTAILPRAPAETLQLSFTSDMSGISSAYLILTPGT